MNNAYLKYICIIYIDEVAIEVSITSLINIVLKILTNSM